MKNDRSSRELSEILGDLAREEDRLGEALQLAEDHLLAEPGDTDILEWRIRLLEQMGRSDEALVAFDR